MQCPKCAAVNQEGASICARCGIVFEKYYRYHPRPGEDDAPPAPRRTAVARESRLRGLLLPPEPKADWVSLAGRAAVLLFLLLWGIRLMASPIAGDALTQSFLHLVNLPFHEAGHVVFRPFGAFMHSLGGTLGQLLMPAVCCAVLLLRTCDPFGAAVALWWFGENFLDIAPYIDDARAGALPLLGGNFGHSAPYGFHDWEYLLTETGLLHLDHGLARTSFTVGCLTMASALAWGAALLLGQYRALAKTRV
jgi:hypothetical protein